MRISSEGSNSLRPGQGVVAFKLLRKQLLRKDKFINAKPSGSVLL